MECCINTEKLEILRERMKSAIASSYPTTIFAFSVNYFQIFVWTTYFAYDKETIFACWVLRKRSFYVIKLFDYLFDCIIIGIQCHNWLFSRKVYHELIVHKLWFLHLYIEIFHWRLIPVHHLPCCGFNNSRRSDITCWWRRERHSKCSCVQSS